MDKEQLNQLVEFLQKTAEHSRDFLAEQAPLIAAEMLAWRFWQDVLAIVVCASIALTLYLVGRGISRSAAYKHWLEHGFQSWPAHYGLWLAIMIPSIVSTCFLFDAVKCRVAPRLVLIEEVQKLVAPLRR